MEVGVGLEQSRAEQIRADQSRADQIRADQTRPEQIRLGGQRYMGCAEMAVVIDIIYKESAVLSAAMSVPVSINANQFHLQRKNTPPTQDSH